MSEQSKIAYLQEKIKEAKNDTRAGQAIIVFSLMYFAVLYVGLKDFGTTITPTLLLVTVGIAVMLIFGCYLLFSGAWKKAGLIGQLKAISARKCAGCGILIPNTNITFCPYCGKKIV